MAEHPYEKLLPDLVPELVALVEQWIDRGVSDHDLLEVMALVRSDIESEYDDPTLVPLRYQRPPLTINLKRRRPIKEAA